MSSQSLDNILCQSIHAYWLTTIYSTFFPEISIFLVLGHECTRWAAHVVVMFKMCVCRT
eukprot:COSAG02_NODE_1015_length_15191_cov_6.937450_7_plen_59_part_00